MNKKRTHQNVRELIRNTFEDQGLAKKAEERIAKRSVVKLLMRMRAKKGMSQVDMAQLMKCTQSRVSKLESDLDDDLRLGELRDYLHSLDHDIMLVISKKRWTLMDQIKFHAFQIRSCLGRLVKLADDDKALTKGVSMAHVETIYNMALLVADSAKRLPEFSLPFPTVIDADEDCDEATDDGIPVCAMCGSMAEACAAS